jgi:hypothetical protein
MNIETLYASYVDSVELEIAYFWGSLTHRAGSNHHAKPDRRTCVVDDKSIEHNIHVFRREPSHKPAAMLPEED